MSKSKKQMLHSAVGIAIMLFFRYLPIQLPEITPIGMQVLGIFIGTLYLWTTVDPLWSSLMSIAMIGLSDFMEMPALLKECFGNPTLIQILFLLILAGALVYYKITLHIGRFFLTRKFTNGKPWLLTFVVCLGCYLMSGFVYPFTAIFLFWPVLYSVFDEIGYKKGDAFPRVILTLIILSALIGFPMAPYANNGLALLSNFASVTSTMTGEAVQVNNAAYMAIAIVTGVLMILGCVLYAKIVIRPDVSKLKEFDVETLNRNPLPPLDLQQKILSGGFILLVLCMLLPSLCPSVPGMQFLLDNSTGIGLLIVAVLAALVVKEKRVLDVSKVLCNEFNWSSFFIVSAAILIGSVLTNENTGVSAFLKTVLSPIFDGMSPLIFTVVLMLIAVVLTNLCNSLVIGMILQPIIVTYCMGNGTAMQPIVTLLIVFVLASAAVTPAASPFAAILHSNKEWVPTKYVYQYTIPFVIIELVIILAVGIPMASVLM